MGGVARHGRAVALVLVLTGALACATYSSGFYHEVQRGETLYRIGQRYGVPARELAKANGIRDVTNIQVGQKIWIPKASGQTAPKHPSFVKKGDKPARSADPKQAAAAATAPSARRPAGPS